MDEILRSVGILLKRSESQQKKIRRILHYPTNFVARTWVKLSSLRTCKVKVTYALFYVFLAFVLFYVLSVGSRLGSSVAVKNGVKHFLSENFIENSKNVELEGMKSHVKSYRIVPDKKISGVKKIERELYKGENIDYKARSAQTFHIEGFKKMYNNGVASQAQNFGNDKDASRSKINDVLRINLPIDGEFRFQNNTRLFGNEGRLSRNKDIIRPPSAIFQDEFLGRPVINPHHHRLLLNNDRLCDKGRKVSLFISVLSSVRHFEQRDAVRRTWGSGLSLAPLRARIAFFLASPPQQEAHVQSQITIEAQTYGDIIQEDFLDTYHNLTLKSIMALKWAEANCPQAEYFMKTDDDIFVNVPKLLTFLQEQSQLRDYFIAGCIKQQKSFAPVNLPSSFPMPPSHPLFLAGAGYVLTGGLVPLLYQASLHTPIIPVEDVYVTGHLAGKLGAHLLLHHPHFTCGELLLDDCDAMQVFTGHHITPRRMMEIWDKINPVEYSDSPCFDF